MRKFWLSLAFFASVLPADASAQLMPDAMRLDPPLPDGTQLFRSLCLDAGFSGAEGAVRRAGLRRIDFVPASSVWAGALVTGASYLRGDPGRKSADDVVVTVGTADVLGVPAATCSVLSFATPLSSIEALALPVDPRWLEEAFAADQPPAIRPPVVGTWSVPGVAAGRGVTLLTLARFGRPDAPGTTLSLDTMTAADAARLAGTDVFRRLAETPLPDGDALRRREPGAGPMQPQESTP